MADHTLQPPPKQVSVKLTRTMITENGFENGERVPVTTPGEMDAHDHDCPPDIELRFDFSEADEVAIEKEVERRSAIDQAAAIKKILFLMIDAEMPRRAAYQLAYACGMGALCNGSASSIAKRFGQSKQAFEQEGDRLLAAIQIRKSPLMKSEEAAKKYSKTNFRKDKIK